MDGGGRTESGTEVESDAGSQSREDPEVIEKILNYLERKDTSTIAPRLPPSRGPHETPRLGGDGSDRKRTFGCAWIAYMVAFARSLVWNPVPNLYIRHITIRPCAAEPLRGRRRLNSGRAL